MADGKGDAVSIENHCMLFKKNKTKRNTQEIASADNV